jgi:hypothetical protein
MFLNRSSNFRHLPSLITGFRRFPISRLSNSTMKMLRLPLPFSFPSVSLGMDTTDALLLILPITPGVASFLCNQVLCSCGEPYPASLRVETVGPPMFPRLPNLPLIWSKTPTRPPQLAYIAASVLSLSCRKQRPWFLNTPSEAQYIPSTVAVYASRQHLY